MDIINYVYYDFWNLNGDPRVTKYPLMDGGPLYTILLSGIYLYISIYAGKRFMNNRSPFNLKKTIFIYNVFLVLLNLYFFVNGLWLTNFGLESWSCKKPDSTSTKKEDLTKIFFGWLFFISKFIDFMDTFFFILRKKYDHLSFLHLYHHSMMPVTSWIGLKFSPGGNMAFIPLVNSFVHVLMYTYYALSTFSTLKPYLWWKPYITQLQLTQFVLVIIHSIYSISNPSCEFPKFIIYLSIVNAVLFFYLFYSFYRSTFRKKKKEN